MYHSRQNNNLILVTMLQPIKNTIKPRQLLSASTRRMSKTDSIKLVVCDMHGTIITDNGISKKCFKNALKDFRIEINLKRSRDIAELSNKLNEFKYNINEKFEEYLYNEYYDNQHQLKLINEDLGDYFEDLRSKDIKIALNTEYCAPIQWFISDVLNLENMVDGFISSENVRRGRPYPDMIQQLMAEFDIEDPRQVCKIGDTLLDVQEAHNAGCGLVVSVLTGDCDKQELESNGQQHMILDNVTSLKLV